MALDTLTLPLLPLTTGVVLPGMVVTIALETPEAKAAVEAASAGGEGLLLLVPKIDGRYARVGVVARIQTVGELANGNQAVVVAGLHRATVGTGVPGSGTATWVLADAADEGESTDRARDLARTFKATVEAILERRGGRRLAEIFSGLDDPSAIADTVGYWPELSVERKVEALETVAVEARLDLVLQWAKDALAELELKDRIRNDVSEGMDKRQREFLLRQQLAAIRKELGEDDDDETAPEAFRAKLEALGDAIPSAARAAIEKEINRLERMSDQSPETGWVRTWLETVFEIPWGSASEDSSDLSAARAVLDADHTGLKDVKERLVEFLAVRSLRASRPAPSEADGAVAPRRGVGTTLALVGPPGVGKTSLGESVARALGRKFVRVALGGVRDEAEIRGHRRTYVGAQAGRIVRAMKEAGTMNPVMLLDEIDKVGGDWRGDPSAALLEVLDPAQNHTFRDHYLEVDLDLSEVLFIATANVLDTIPAPLLDRMEVIRLDGYTEEEKVAIARDHLLSRQTAANGLNPGDVAIGDDVLSDIVAGHTREAGVRSLERAVGKVVRKVATAIVTGDSQPPVVVDSALVRSALGRPKFEPESEVASRVASPGVATGLAVTGAGGDVLFVEATSMEGEGLTVTGQLGDVMKESAQIALSFVRSHADAFGIDRSAFENKRFHIHFPAGAVPKDGPSAGVTMTTALVSLLTGRQVKPTVGMTGEVTLQGHVLPIGGLKQKVMAAHRSGLTDVIAPARNEPDVDDIPASVLDEVTIHWASDVRDVVEAALAS